MKYPTNVKIFHKFLQQNDPVPILVGQDSPCSFLEFQRVLFGSLFTRKVFPVTPITSFIACDVFLFFFQALNYFYPCFRMLRETVDWLFINISLHITCHNRLVVDMRSALFKLYVSTWAMLVIVIVIVMLLHFIPSFHSYLHSSWLLPTSVPSLPLRLSPFTLPSLLCNTLNFLSLKVFDLHQICNWLGLLTNWVLQSVLVNFQFPAKRSVFHTLFFLVFVWDYLQSFWKQ